MLKKLPIAVALISTLLASGCATHLSPGQERELNGLKEKGLYIEEKNVAGAAALGVFPIAGYAYVGHPGLAITSILTWPFLGPIWMPFDVGYAAQNRNYYATLEYVEKEKRKALRELDHQLEDKAISYEQHIREQRLIEAKYSPY